MGTICDVLFWCPLPYCWWTITETSLNNAHSLIHSLSLSLTHSLTQSLSLKGRISLQQPIDSLIFNGCVYILFHKWMMLFTGLPSLDSVFTHVCSHVAWILLISAVDNKLWFEYLWCSCIHQSVITFNIKHLNYLHYTVLDERDLHPLFCWPPPWCSG